MITHESITINVVELKPSGSSQAHYRWEVGTDANKKTGKYHPYGKFKHIFPTVEELIYHVVEIVQFDGCALFDYDLTNYVKSNMSNIHVLGFPK